MSNRAHKGRCFRDRRRTARRHKAQGVVVDHGSASGAQPKLAAHEFMSAMFSAMSARLVEDRRVKHYQKLERELKAAAQAQRRPQARGS